MAMTSITGRQRHGGRESTGILILCHLVFNHLQQDVPDFNPYSMLSAIISALSVLEKGVVVLFQNILIRLRVSCKAALSTFSTSLLITAVFLASLMIWIHTPLLLT